MNTPYMYLKKLTPSQYTHSKVVETFSDLFFHYNAQGLTHISQIHFYAAVIEGIRYDVN